MIEITMKCDYCKTTIQSGQETTLHVCLFPTNYTKSKKYELCLECAKDFEAWHNERWPFKVKR